jgi:hypothetical protein
LYDIQGTSAVEVERVPAPQSVPEVQAEAYPQIAAGVPGPHSELSPADASQRREALPVLAAEPPRTRPEVRAEYVPEDDPEPFDDSPPPPGEDTLTGHARADFLPDLVAGDLPTYRALKTKYGIGQPRATRIRAELEKGLPA